MILYDGKSDVEWFYEGRKTAGEMRAEERYSRLFSEPCVLMDDTRGKAYSFRPLAEVCAEYGVEAEDPQAALEALPDAIAASWKPEPTAEEQVAALKEELARMRDEYDAALMELAAMQEGEM